MAGKKLFIIGTRASVADEALAEAVYAQWPAAQRPVIEAHSVPEIAEDLDLLDDAAVAWLIPPADDALSKGSVRNWIEFIEQLQERFIPILFTTDDQSASRLDGVVAVSPQSPPAAFVAGLRALWSQIEAIRALQLELQILHAHQGGLCGQIQTLDEELRLAAQLQREFLPRELPQMDDVEFRVLYQPAGYVSGDMYDVQRLDDEHLGFFIADAVGHGVPAALLTMYIKSAVHPRDFDWTIEGADPAFPDRILRRLNANMCRQQTAKVRFATACYGLLNTRTRELQLARAGHPLPYLFRADGSCEMIETDGPLLGIFPEAEFPATLVKLAEGDRLLLYTDGFELAFGEGGEVDYTDRLKQMANGTLDEAMTRLQCHLDREAGSLHQNDDLTMVLMGVGCGSAQSSGAGVSPAIAAKR